MNEDRSTRMVDITGKAVTKRTARARAAVLFPESAYRKLKNGESPKGNVIETSKVAGIMAAKSTPAIIPMCHPLELGKIDIEIILNDEEFTAVIEAEVSYSGRTGVEMEALTAVSAAALTVYDMMKWADKGIRIQDVQLLSKTGGKSGDYSFEDA